MWASRISRQKRPELLRAVAALRPQIDFKMYGDFYDAHLYHPNSFIEPNLTYGGWYRTLADVRLEDANAFLYTSGWDGMPNILLAAGALGVPVVAADVGGVGEIVDAASGWPVKDHGNPKAYAQALDALLADGEEAARRADVMLDRLHARHTEAAFRARIRELALFP